MLARTRALILCISIWKFDFGPVKLPGLSRKGPLAFSLIERFSREFGLDAIILLRRILPKGSKSALSVDVRPAQTVFCSSSLLKS